MTIAAAPILSPLQAQIATLTDADLGDRLWDAWTEEQNGHPVRRKVARQMLRTLASEALRRGHRVLAEQFTVGQTVRDHGQPETGTVVAIGTDGSVTVDFGWENTRHGVRQRRMCYLSTSLLGGNLVAA